MWILTQDKEQLNKVCRVYKVLAMEYGDATKSLICGQIETTGQVIDLGYYYTPENAQIVLMDIADAIARGDSYYEMPPHKKKEEEEK